MAYKQGTKSKLDIIKPASVVIVNKVLAKAKGVSGLTFHPTSHDIRRSAASDASTITSGAAPIEKVAIALGHGTTAQDRATTLRYVGPARTSTWTTRLNPPTNAEIENHSVLLSDSLRRAYITKTPASVITERCAQDGLDASSATVRSKVAFERSMKSNFDGAGLTAVAPPLLPMPLLFGRGPMARTKCYMAILASAPTTTSFSTSSSTNLL
ncbi:hypothetical protein MRB53_042170 [Persea americana]|nr:hypothetical protein MRB53_042170 [Persea americana]